MIGEETVEAARNWCEVGADWIVKGAVKLGLNYLDRAIAVFSENAELNWLTYARHCRLEGLKQTGWEEEAEAMFPQVMSGYLRLQDLYGQALLLIHLAQCMVAQGRGEQSLTQFQMAAAIAETRKLETLHAHALVGMAHIHLERNNLIQALRLYRQGEGVLQAKGREMDALHLRFAAAEALMRLGERADAVAFLEDMQARLLREKHYREALKPLRLLGELYEQSDSWDEKARITQLVHSCGQHIVQNDLGQEEQAFTQPLVRLVAQGVGEDKPHPALAGPG